ncbi:MAG TPA: site-2 protease family protein [Roseiflexaceae bacterium]|nr:site-2 protease family protein [Roseiflexaceae bacterium]
MLTRALPISSIGGIAIRLHWSWVVSLLLVVAALGQIYGETLSSGEAWLTACAAALLLCASVILHELGHALVARHYGLTVHAVTLFALGGVTEIADAPPEPVRDFLVAIAGPAVSLLLTLLGGLAWWFAHEAMALVLLHMALTNGAIVLFNLLPGYPLDGGRALWAVIAFLTDDELAAARVAALIGRVCGWVLLAGGALYALANTDLLGGLLVGAMGYFLIRNATIGYRQFVLRRMLSGVQVSDLMQRVFRAVAPELPLDQFVGRYVLGQTDQGFPVVQRPDTDSPQPLLGMMTLRDLRRFQLSEWAFTYVGEAMTPFHRLRVLPPGMAAGEAFRTLLESGEDQLPVLEGATLLGVLRRRDLISYIERRSRHPDE